MVAAIVILREAEPSGGSADTACTTGNVCRGLSRQILPPPFGRRKNDDFPGA